MLALTKNTAIARAWLKLLLCLLGGACAPELLAQGRIEAIRTSTGLPSIISRMGLVVSESLPQLQFRFGFATDEEAEAGTFLDSATGSLQAADSVSGVMVLFTVDRTGVSWAPHSPGTVFLDPNTIDRRPASFPSLEPPLRNQSAFEVVVEVPTALRDRPLNFSFALFDNENSVLSLGWLSEVTVVPEPNVDALVAVFLGCSIFWRRRK